MVIGTIRVRILCECPKEITCIFSRGRPSAAHARSFRGRRPPCTHNLRLTGICGTQTPAAASAPPSPADTSVSPHPAGHKRHDVNGCEHVVLADRHSLRPPIQRWAACCNHAQQCAPTRLLCHSSAHCLFGDCPARGVALRPPWTGERRRRGCSLAEGLLVHGVEMKKPAGWRAVWMRPQLRTRGVSLLGLRRNDQVGRLGRPLGFALPGFGLATVRQAHLCVDDALCRRTPHVGRKADGPRGLDDDRARLRPVDAISGCRGRFQGGGKVRRKCWQIGRQTGKKRLDFRQPEKLNH
ncbi:hypothetical protein P3T32_002209 [Ralstonia sp. GP73]|nr:hypothetical protein [Ralstonia sp. GP73]